ncbi:MAG: hypothetical protein QW723_01520 [Candidatus Bathyarchaeia archaeon]
MFSKNDINDKVLIEILIASTAILAFNSWEHMPSIVPNHYSDIVSIFWREGVGKGQHSIPYLQFLFEYPVIIGMLVYLCSSTRLFASSFSEAIVYYTLSMHFILSLFTLLSIYLLYKTCNFLRVDKGRIWKCFLIMPSFLMFPLYNWDMIAVFFSILSIYSFLNEKRRVSALSLGLGISTKIYPIVMLPMFLIEEKNWRERVFFILMILIPTILLNAPFIVLNFNTWFGTWIFLASWGIENSWLIYFFNQMDPTAHYIGFLVMLYLIYKSLVETNKKPYECNAYRIIERSLMMNLAWLIGSYIVTPQMALMLLPFYVLIPKIPLSLAYLSDILNVLIIVFWFSLMQNNINPLDPTSITQIVATLRQIVWLIIFLYILYPEKVTRLWSYLKKPLK